MDSRVHHALFRIEKLCSNHGFVPAVVSRKAKRMLIRYREMMNHVQSSTFSEEEVRDKTIELIRRKLNKVRNQKNTLIVENLEKELNSIITKDYIDDLIERVFDKMDQLNLPVKEYRAIISNKFLNLTELSDEEVIENTGMSRMSFYRRKKEALPLFGICLWIIMKERVCK
jgi:thiamine kinase-like enzyme